MTASGYARRSVVAEGAGSTGGKAGQLSTSERYALAVGLLLVGVGALAAIDLVLLPRYFAGATRLVSPPHSDPSASATPTAEEHALPPPASAPVVEAPSRPEPAQRPGTEAPAAVPTPADIVESELPHLLFARNTTWLSPEAREILARLAAVLAENPSRRVVLGGHTDNAGPENLNRALSLARARKCSHWLEGRGIDPARIDIQGFGSTRPVAGDDSSGAQAHNRRVEIDLR
jgi:outer membrane protein OmpA-like peptidoglycan-associated protein